MTGEEFFLPLLGGCNSWTFQIRRPPPGKKETGLQPVFAIIVEDPQKLEDPIRAFIMYAVHCNDYGSPIHVFEFSSFRRFSRPVAQAQRSSHFPFTLSHHPTNGRVASLSPSPLSCRKKHHAVSHQRISSRSRLSGGQVEVINPLANYASKRVSSTAMTDQCII